MSKKKSDSYELSTPEKELGGATEQGGISLNGALEGCDTVDRRFVDGALVRGRGDTEEGRSVDQHEGWTGNSNPLASKMQNKFQARRNVTQGMYDVALLMANVAQLKSVLDYKDHQYYTLLLVLLVASISLHIISAVLLYIIMIIEKNEQNKRNFLDEQNSQNNNNKKKELGAEKAAPTGCVICSNEICRCWKIHPLDNVATICVFGVTLMNIFVIAFLSDPKK